MCFPPSFLLFLSFSSSPSLFSFLGGTKGFNQQSRLLGLGPLSYSSSPSVCISFWDRVDWHVFLGMK
jgi:hypothetical protein